jgi:hypothetical protein
VEPITQIKSEVIGSEILDYYVTEYINQYEKLMMKTMQAQIRTYRTLLWKDYREKHLPKSCEQETLKTF